MDATPETRMGRHHAPRPASLSHPHRWGPCSELRRPLLRAARSDASEWAKTKDKRNLIEK